MSLRCKIRIILILIVVSISTADIQQAYGRYMAGDYRTSLSMYKASYFETPQSKEALYGVVNSYAALLQYEDALTWCDSLLHREMDAVIVEKKMWLLGLTNKGRSAGTLWKNRAVKAFSQERRRSIAMSCGWGFYGVGNYRAAAVWFAKAEKIDDGIDITQALLLTEQKRKELKPQGSVALYGGPILYSGQTITDESGDSYRYKSGSYYGGEASLTFNRRHTVTVMASRFDATLADQKYYLEGDTVLFWDTVYTGTKLYGIEVDTLYRSLDEQFAGGIYNLQDKIDSLTNIGFTLDTAIGYNLNGFPDTAFYFFHVDSLGELDTINTDGLNYEKYDSVYWRDTVEWDSSVTWRDTVTVQPDPLWQNTLYVGYVGKKIGGENLTVGTGIQLFNSNMDGMKRGIVLWLMNRHSTKWFDVAGNWYFTAMEKRRMAQSSVQLMRQWGKLFILLEPTITFGLTSDTGYEPPTVQHSLGLDARYFFKRVTLLETLIVGSRKYTAESMGMNLATVAENHQITSVSKVVVYPFKNEKISLFGILRFEKYDSFDRKIVLGGVNYTW